MEVNMKQQEQDKKTVELEPKFTNCKNCGILQDKNDKFCYKCGKKLELVYELE